MSRSWQLSYTSDLSTQEYKMGTRPANHQTSCCYWFLSLDWNSSIKSSKYIWERRLKKWEYMGTKGLESESFLIHRAGSVKIEK